MKVFSGSSVQCPVAHQTNICTNASYTGTLMAAFFDYAPGTRQKPMTLPAGITPYPQLTLIDVFNPTNAPVSLTVTNASLLAATSVSGAVHGLNFACYQSATAYTSDAETNWLALPNLASLTPVSSGAVNGLDLTPRQRRNGYAFDFSGYIYAPSNGLYTFTLNSCDGSKLSVDGQGIIHGDGDHSAADFTIQRRDVPGHQWHAACRHQRGGQRGGGDQCLWEFRFERDQFGDDSGDANGYATGPQDGNGNWGGSANTWWNGLANVTWADNSLVIFGNGATTNCAVLLTNNVTPGSMLFNANNGGNYNFSSSGGSLLALAGTPTITCNDNATITATLNGGVLSSPGAISPKSEVRNPQPDPGSRIRGLARECTHTFSEQRKTQFGFRISGFFRISRIRISDFVLTGLSILISRIRAPESPECGMAAFRVR